MPDFWAERGGVRFLCPPEEEMLCALVEAGLHVACVPFDAGEDVCGTVFSHVRSVFRAKNHPIGLMLEADEGALEGSLAFAVANSADFLLLTAQSAASVSAQRAGGVFPVFCARVKSASDLVAAINAPVRGVLLERYDPSMSPWLAKLRTAGIFLWIADEVAGKIRETADGFLTSPEGFAFMRAEPERTFREERDPFFVPTQLQRAVSELYGKDTRLIVALTTDGENVRQAASLYLPVPLIAVARRPKYERLLLSLIAHRHVAPTAITRVLPAERRLLFAANVAGLYGFTSGGAIVLGQCWEHASGDGPIPIDLALQGA